MLNPDNYLIADLDQSELFYNMGKILNERKRSWIILLLFNERLHDLYMNNFSLCEKILSFYSCYQTKVLSFNNMNLNSLNDMQFNIFCNALAKCTQLNKLDLASNELGKLNDLRLFNLLMTIKCCVKLENLYFGNNQFTSKQMLCIISNLNIPNIEFSLATPKGLIFSGGSNTNDKLSIISNISKDPTRKNSNNFSNQANKLKL